MGSEFTVLAVRLALSEQHFYCFPLTNDWLCFNIFTNFLQYINIFFNLFNDKKSMQGSATVVVVVVVVAILSFLYID